MFQLHHIQISYSLKFDSFIVFYVEIYTHNVMNKLKRDILEGYIIA